MASLFQLALLNTLPRGLNRSIIESRPVDPDNIQGSHQPISFSPIDLCLSCVCVVIDTTCNIYVGVLLGWQSEYLVPPGVSSETYAPAWTWHIVD